MSNALQTGHDRRTPLTRKRCPKCHEPIDGITTTDPTSHEFEPCGHSASEELLTPPDDSIPLIELLSPNE